MDDLTLESWNYDIKKMRFNSVEELKLFVEKCQNVMDKVLYDQDHDRVRCYVDFYEAYKLQSLPLSDFYRQYQVEQLGENTLTCRGRTLKLKRSLSTELSQEYPDVIVAPYVTTTTLNFRDLMRKITKQMESNHHHLFYFHGHAILTIKFDLNGRIGFVIFDNAMGAIKAAVTMMDNQPPSDKTVDFGKRVAKFTCLSENFVELYGDQKNPAIPVNKFRMGIYVGGSFQRMDLVGKLTLLNNMEDRYVIRGTRLMARVVVFQGATYFRVTVWDGNIEDYYKIEIPFEYFTQSVAYADGKYDSLLEKLAQLLEEDELLVRSWLRKFSLIQLDTDFLKQLSQLKLELEENRKLKIKNN